MKNDQNIKNQLISMGWKVIVIWECELSKMRFDDTMKRIVNEIKGINLVATDKYV